MSRISALALAVACTAGCGLLRATVPEGVSVGTLHVLQDSAGKATLQDVLGSPERFHAVARGTPNYNFTHDAYWFRLPVQNRRSQAASLFLNVQHSTLDHLALFVVKDGRVRRAVISGDRLAARDRPYPATSLVLPFSMDAGEKLELFLRVQSDAGTVLVPMEVSDERQLASWISSERLIHGVMLGVFGALFVYNFWLFLLLKDRTYFFYLVYLPFAYLANTSLNGFGSAFLYPGAVWPSNEGVPFFAAIAFALILLFTRSFLRSRDHRILDAAVKILIAANIADALSVFVLPVRVCYECTFVMVFILPTFGMALGLRTWMAGKTEARFYVLGQAASWIGLPIFGLLIMGWLPYRMLLLESISLGIMTDALLLALALADRIRLLQKAKRAAEDRERKAMQAQQAELERLVASRTADLEAARTQAERLAVIDPLTGILNRRGLLERAARDVQLAIRSGRPVAAVMFDIDRFKLINDRYGHAIGDRVLREVVETARDIVRATDLFGRVGGEEFLLIMPDTRAPSAEQIAERIRLAIAEKVVLGVPPRPVTASFGIAAVTEHKNSLDWLQSAADAALYKAKNRGRNRTEIFAGDLHSSPEEPGTLEPLLSSDY